MVATTHVHTKYSTIVVTRYVSWYDFIDFKILYIAAIAVLLSSIILLLNQGTL